MDRSLDDMITEKQRSQRGRRDGRNNDYPRDGVRKPRQRDTDKTFDKDWVHDRYDGDRSSRPAREPRGARDLYPTGRDSERAPPDSAKLRVENLHYDLTEADLEELFNRIGPLASLQLLYDRTNRSRGIAYVTYKDIRDARDAVREFDGANAYGQPIKLTLLPSGPAAERGGRAGNLMDRVSGRSLFDRIEGGGEAPRRRTRSESPVDRERKPGRAPEYIDRYVPGRSNSPAIGGRGGRRPGARREDSGRGGRGRGRGGRDDEGRPLVGGRPRKTAEELDAEMTDYWASGQADTTSASKNDAGLNTASDAAQGPADGDVDMIE